MTRERGGLRRWQRGRGAFGVFAVLGLLIAGTAGGSTDRTRPDRTRAVAVGERWVSFPVPAGPSDERAEITEPAGVIRQIRVVVPPRTRARLTAVIPGLIGVDISTPVARDDPSGACTLRSGADVCTQAEEACPIPAATWQLRLRKLAGPAGRVRIELVVG